MARSYEATTFFRISLKGILGFFIISLLGDSFNGFLPTMVKYALATLIGSVVFNPNLAETLKSYIGAIRMRPTYSNCCVVASTVKCIYDTLSKTDDMKYLKMLPLVCVCMLSAVTLVCDRDHSGLTEGILIASAKWFIINCMAFKWERSAISAAVMAHAILALFTSVGEPFRDRTDDGPPLERNVYFTGEPHEVRQRSSIVLKLFWLCFLMIKYIGGMVVVCFVGGVSLFKEVVTGFIKYQQQKEQRRWFVAVGLMGILESFLDENNILSLIIITAISIFIICVVSIGWDHDRTGVTDGLFMTYFQWTALFLINSKSSWQLLMCGLTLSAVIASKFSEPLDPLEKQS
ncbi:hypothetical protein MKW94_017802 [Papaver nudicaule]|uniref:Uncharacterized protein n=1 Tax=Papaver nudicaule TaxID=74823 RepID=A0AA41S239_PAPNU|nr:hypothetical protein [Papaver nudicaule]